MLLIAVRTSPNDVVHSVQNSETEKYFPHASQRRPKQFLRLSFSVSARRSILCALRIPQNTLLFVQRFLLQEEKSSRTADRISGEATANIRTVVRFRFRFGAARLHGRGT